MKFVKTVKCKLEVDEEQRQTILDTIAKFTQACNDALALARKNKLWNAYKLHHLCYRQLTERYSIPTQYSVRAIGRVCAKRKRRPKSFKAKSLDLDIRLFRFIEATEPPSISLATTKGRLKIKLAIGNFQRGLLKGQKPTSATLVYKKVKERKSFYINFVLEKEVPIPSGSNPNRVVGVDRGIYNLATTSNGLKFSGKQAKHIRKHYSHLRQRLQAKGTKDAKRVLKRVSGKERRWMSNLNHNISKKIVDSCKAGDILALEELKHIRTRIRTGVRLAKKQRLIHHSWAFGQLQTFIEYKALERGIAVVYVSPKHTSQKCPKCKHVERANRNGHRFCCVVCGYKHNADLVSPLNIRQVAIDANGWASVNTPLSSPAESLTPPILGTASSDR